MTTVRAEARARGAVGAVTGLVLGVMVLGPALLPGYTLHYDLVFVPDLALSRRTLGVDGSVPRAVPNDLVVALLSLGPPGWFVQKGVLLGSLVAAGAGAARLARTRLGAFAAAVAYVWNPWVGERLGIGHWGFLIGYAMLPWVAVAAARARRAPTRRSLGALALTLTLGALGGSTAGVLTTALAMVVVLAPGLRPRRSPWALLTVGAVALLANAPWWWPFLRAASRAADPEGVPAFAAKADTPFGVVGSLVLGGGLWNAQTWYVERRSWLVAGAALVVVAGALVVALRRREFWQDPARAGVALAGGLGLVVAAAAALGPGAAVVTTVVMEVPGGGLLRDGQKFVALWVLLTSVTLAWAVEEAARRTTWVLAAAVAIAPVATLPTLAAGHLGAWGSVDLPRELTSLADDVDRAEPGAVAVLPWSTYRRYAWNDERVTLDPWNRLLSREVLSDDTLRLQDRDVAGEDPRAARVGRAVAGEGDVAAVLRELGVRHVVVATDQPGADESVRHLEGETLRAERGSTRWYDLGPLGAGVRPSAGPGAPPVPGDRWWGLVGLGAALVVSLAAAMWPTSRRPRDIPQAEESSRK